MWRVSFAVFVSCSGYPAQTRSPTSGRQEVRTGVSCMTSYWGRAVTNGHYCNRVGNSVHEHKLALSHLTYDSHILPFFVTGSRVEDTDMGPARIRIHTPAKDRVLSNTSSTRSNTKNSVAEGPLHTLINWIVRCSK